MSTVRMRFPAQALEDLRKADPETPVTLNMIRRLMKTGAVPSVPVGGGKRRLVNYDALLAYLAAPVEENPNGRAQGIRRIDERPGA